MDFEFDYDQDGIKFRFGESAEVLSFCKRRKNTLATFCKRRKNTLATKKHSNLIFFGIARCNFDMDDNFDKQKGKYIAYKRLSHAYCDGILEQGVQMADKEKTCVFSANGLYGVCHVEALEILLNYFYDVDAYALADRNDRWSK